MFLFLAQAGGGATKMGGGFLQLLIPFGLMFAIMYFLMIRPQKKKERERKDMISRVRKNDKVITSGGIHGKVVTLKENTVLISIDESKDINMKIDRNSIATAILADDEEE